MAGQPGFFDTDERLQALSAAGDPLERKFLYPPLMAYLFAWVNWFTPGVSLGLWCFCPNVLAHARLVTSDVGATALGVRAGTTMP